MDTIIDIVNISTAVITVASVIVASTPSQKDDEVLGKVKAFIMPILKKLSLNVGHAKL